MNLVNVAKHLLHLAETNFGSANDITSSNEMFASQQLFEVLKTYKNSNFSEFYAYETLDFNNEYDGMTDEEESNDDDDDYVMNQHTDISSNFTMEEMENIVEWIDEHPNYSFSTIQHRFPKIKSTKDTTRFRQYIEQNGTRLEKLKKIKEFMFNEFYIKRAIEKEAVHDSDLQLFALQKAKELGWDSFKAGATFIKSFKKKIRISSRRYNKLITRSTSNRKVCSVNDAQKWIESKRSLISNYLSHEILNSDHCSFQQECVPPRTLSFTGERTTEVAVKKKNSITHSYTVQPIASADGQLLDKFMLILQEKEYEFGKIVQKNIIIPPNVI
ncbi:unnamed protein product, partial [Rotaria sp. Silwood2]